MLPNTTDSTRDSSIDVLHDCLLACARAQNHPMITRSCAGIVKPNPKYANLHTTDSIPKELSNARWALNILGGRRQ